jgi:hypothetical protein
MFAAPHSVGLQKGEIRQFFKLVLQILNLSNGSIFMVFNKNVVFMKIFITCGKVFWQKAENKLSQKFENEDIL